MVTFGLFFKPFYPFSTLSGSYLGSLCDHFVVILDHFDVVLAFGFVVFVLTSLVH